MAQIELLPFGSALAVFYLGLDLGTAAVWGISVASYLGLLAVAESDRDLEQLAIRALPLGRRLPPDNRPAAASRTSAYS